MKDLDQTIELIKMCHKNKMITEGQFKLLIFKAHSDIPNNMTVYDLEAELLSIHTIEHWKVRFMQEYSEYKVRSKRLTKILTENENNTHIGNTPIELLDEQLMHMQEIMDIMKIRAKHEKIKL